VVLIQGSDAKRVPFPNDLYCINFTGYIVVSERKSSAKYDARRDGGFASSHLDSLTPLGSRLEYPGYRLLSPEVEAELPISSRNICRAGPTKFVLREAECPIRNDFEPGVSGILWAFLNRVRRSDIIGTYYG